MADHEATRIDKGNHFLLDQPLLRLPYELMRKNFRAAHLQVEKDSKAIKDLLRETATGSLSGRTPPENALRNLDTMLARARGLKRKMEACAEEEDRLSHRFAARIAHLGEVVHMESLEDVKYDQWSRVRLDRLLVDYMLRSGYNSSAAALADDRELRDLVDMDTFVTMRKIQDSLRSFSVTDALAWCSENKKELRKIESNLEFMLRFQQYIEMVRVQTMPKFLEAIAHAKKHLTPFKNAYPDEVSEAAGLLSSSPHRPSDPYDHLWSTDRWSMLADLFVEHHHRLLCLPPAPLLHVALSSGLSALKTPSCHNHDSRDGPVVSNDTAMCPICSTELNELARDVPYAHHSKSHVENDLVLLPNGRVYGQARLEEQARKGGMSTNRVKDLRTGEEFDTKDLKKVFIT